jgi:hypothetical protein
MFEVDPLAKSALTPVVDSRYNKPVEFNVSLPPEFKLVGPVVVILVVDVPVSELNTAVVDKFIERMPISDLLIHLEY